MTPLRARLAALALALGLGFAPNSAAAWDPSSTHQGLMEAAVTRSAVHLRWMDASELSRGLFSSLRINPDLLDPDWLRMLELTMRAVHADVGARPLGGPGSCPSADAPAQTQQFCVDRELWEHDAIGWLRLGIVAEVTPASRHLHHFLDREQPDSTQWSDNEIPAAVLRRRAKVSGEPIAGVATQTNFSGAADSALAWLADPSDLLAPDQTYRHLALASSAPSQNERDHYLALALIGVGAMLHVVQDLSVPAHARGDVSAFYAPLSPSAGDRGLPLQEFVRVQYGRRALPNLTPTADTAPLGLPLANTLLEHVLGNDQITGLASLASRHFFSESSVPSPRALPDTLSASEAATSLLGDKHMLDPVEIDGAILSPWPAQRGYLLSPTGRALAAFDTDSRGQIRPYLDEACYRDQALQLLPAAVDTSRSILDLLWPAWPQMQQSGQSVTLSVPEWASAELTVHIQDEHGERRVVGTHLLEVASDNTINLEVGELEAGERVSLMLAATRVVGPPVVLEQLLAITPNAEPEPEPEPSAEVQPEPVDPTLEPSPGEDSDPALDPAGDQPADRPIPEAPSEPE